CGAVAVEVETVGYAVVVAIDEWLRAPRDVDAAVAVEVQAFRHAIVVRVDERIGAPVSDADVALHVVVEIDAVGHAVVVAVDQVVRDRLARLRLVTPNRTADRTES